MDAPKFKLLVLDIDNTLFDWVRYYVNSFRAMMAVVRQTVDNTYESLADEAKQVFEANGSIEFPFLVQELPTVIAHYGDDIDRMLQDLVSPARDAFLEAAEPFLRPYDDVVDTMAEIRRRDPGMAIAALTDAPRYVAMWKLNKLGLLHFFDAVYGLPDPRIPTAENIGRIKVDPEILLKHLQQHDFGFQGKIRVLPEEYEKPGTRGLKTVLMDFELDEPIEARQRVLWVGDNLKKDVGLGRTLGLCSAWASYGANIDPELLTELKKFSPPLNVHKNASLPIDGEDTPRPDLTLESFSDILHYL